MMKCDEFIERVLPTLTKGQDDGDRWCVVYFSKEEDLYRESYRMDSGDALIVIQALIEKFGIDPEVLRQMQKPKTPFHVQFN